MMLHGKMIRHSATGLNKDRLIRFVAKPGVFLLGLTPLGWLAWQWAYAGLGANPIEATIRFLGDWGLRFLLLSLTVTPLRELFGWVVLVRFRRMMGLFAFFYGALHLSSYIGLDQFFDWAAIWADIRKRIYITFGMTAFVLLAPLAATSTKGMIKRLGGPRWKRLHMLTYPASMLAVTHYYLLVKADVREPLLYAGILALLLGYRVMQRLRKRMQRRTA